MGWMALYLSRIGMMFLTLFDINVILLSKMNNYFERDENCQGFIKRDKYTYQS